MAFGAKNTVSAKNSAAKVPAAKPETKAEEKKVLQAEPGTIEPAKPVDGTTTAGAVDGDAMAARARGFGARESEFMQTTVETLAKAREDWQGGPIMALFSLSLNFTEEEIASWPNPDDGDKGNNPYKFTVSYMDGDTRKTKASNFCREFVYGSKTGQYYLTRIDYVKRAGDKGAIKDGIPEDILEMSPEQRHGELTFCEGRIKTAEQSYKKALRLHHHIKKVQEYATGIVVSPIWADGHSPYDHADKDGNVISPEKVMLDRTNEPLAVMMEMPENQPNKWEPFSIAAFMRLNPDKATEKGGGWRNLIESGVTKKEPKKPGEADKPDTLTIKTPDTSVGVAVELHRYLVEIMGEKDRVAYSKLTQMLTQKGNDEYVVTIVELKNMFTDICRNLKLDATYSKLKEAGSELVAA
jgi:hypothetical protein